MPQQFRRFADFYPHYLAEHSNRTCRRLHFVGTSGALALLAAAAATQNVWLVPVAIVCGYGFAWVGHFAFEKNRPATFTHPIYSLIGDWVMWAEIATGRIRF